ncbi:MAG: class I tRNA ligase family protein [Nitrosarchaeum sp.]|nr:class I tRNA ligase family protein [Nitrosarchaeum sp.]
MGKTCQAPFITRPLPILPSEHCDPDIGTGLVTSVPSDAPFDHIALSELKNNHAKARTYGLDPSILADINPLPIIATKGYGENPAAEICNTLGIRSLKDQNALERATQEIYKAGHHTGVMRSTCGPHAGLPVEKAKEAMKAELIATGRAAILHETSRKATDRSGARIIVAIQDNQWFLDFNAPGWKEDAHACLTSMRITPEKYRKEFQDVFAWLDKRPCARLRGLGTHLPQDPRWIIESLSDSTLYMTLYTINGILKERGARTEAITDSFFDLIFTGEGNTLEEAQKLNITQEDISRMREEFAYWYPNDLRHTFAAHLANHLSFSILAHTACLPKTYWPKAYSFHGMVISGGQKMSKSKGNVVTLLDMKRRYGADPFRAFMCSSTSVPSTFNWSEEEMHKMKNHIWQLYTLIKDSTLGAFSTEGLSGTSRAFLSRTERNISRITRALEEMDLRTYAMHILYEIANDYKRLRARTSPRELSCINAHLIPRWITLISPLCPHIAEELWEAHKQPGLASLAPWPETRDDLSQRTSRSLPGPPHNALRRHQNRPGTHRYQARHKHHPLPRRTLEIRPLHTLRARDAQHLRCANHHQGRNEHSTQETEQGRASHHPYTDQRPLKNPATSPRKKQGRSALQRDCAAAHKRTRNTPQNPTSRSNTRTQGAHSPARKTRTPHRRHERKTPEH